MKLKLYHKNFITTFITTVLTLTVFMVILQVFTGAFLSNLADDQFNNAIRQVKQISKLDDLTISRINEIEEANQTNIRLYNTNNELIYPRFNNSGTGLAILEGSQTTIAPAEEQKLRITTELLNIEGTVVIAMISYNANMRSQEIQQIFKSMIPLLLVIGVLMSLLVSYIYSKSTVKKIQNMNETMTLMSTLQYTDTHDLKDGDELNDLENQIHFLYQQLLNEMDKIKKFEMDRQVFMRGTIHELKTPIMIMDMQIREILEDETLSDEQLRQVYEVQARLNAMRELVNGGLDISKLESITDLEEVYVNEITEEVLEYYESMVQDKSITLSYDGISHQILMHEKHLSTILSNLISNAILYSPQNGEILIVQDEHRFEIRNTFEGEIENFESLNKPFTRGVADKDGHGLGLYIVSTTLQKYSLNYDYYLKDDYFVFTFEY